MQHSLTQQSRAASVASPSPFWSGAAGLFGVVALLKGLRRPGAWAISQLEITYIHGFLKRGLLGELLYIAHLRSRRALIAFCLAEVAALVVLLALLTWQSGLLHRRGSPVLVAAFAGSYAMTFLAHLAGYHDLALYALVVAVVLVRNLRLRFLLAFPLCLFAPLIHENFLLTALPVLLFSFLAEGNEHSYRYVVALLTLSGLLTLGLATHAPLSPSALDSFVRETVARTPFAFDPHSLGILGLSLRQNVELNADVIRHQWGWWADSAVAVLVLGPLVVLLLHRAWRIAPSRALRAALLCASIAPLLLNSIGWDNVRWATLCALSSFGNLALLSRAAGPRPRMAATSAERHAAILVMGLGLASGHGLMDSARINPYPFFPSFLRSAIARHDNWPMLGTAGSQQPNSPIARIRPGHVDPTHHQRR